MNIKLGFETYPAGTHRRSTVFVGESTLNRSPLVFLFLGDTIFAVGALTSLAAARGNDSGGGTRRSGGGGASSSLLRARAHEWQ